MNKINQIVAAAVVSLAAVSGANAAGVAVYGVHDYNVSQNGVRVEASVGEFWRITPTVSYTYVHDTYSRYALGGALNLVKVGNVSFDVTAAGVYQHTNNGTNGYGLTAGLRGSVDLTENVQLVAGVERFAGQSRVNNFDGNVATIGVNVKF